MGGGDRCRATRWQRTRPLGATAQLRPELIALIVSGHMHGDLAAALTTNANTFLHKRFTPLQPLHRMRQALRLDADTPGEPGRAALGREAEPMRRVIDIEHNSRALLRLLGSGLICCLLAQPAAAEDSDAASGERGLSPNYVWLSASAALMTASLGGLFALRVTSTYDQAQALPAVSPEQLHLKRDTERAEFAADCLFASAAALGITSVLLALATDWSRLQPATDQRRLQPATDQRRLQPGTDQRRLQPATDQHASTEPGRRAGLDLRLMPVVGRHAATLVLRGVLP
jgi:hypothetical protein